MSIHDAEVAAQYIRSRIWLMTPTQVQWHNACALDISRWHINRGVRITKPREVMQVLLPGPSKQSWSAAAYGQAREALQPLQIRI